MNPVQPIDPYRRFLEELFALIVVVFFVAVLWLPDAVCVMRLVVEYEDVLLPADFPADHAVHHRRVALDVFVRLDAYALEASVFVLFLAKNLEQPRRDLPFQFIWRKVTSAPRRGRFCADGYGFFDADRAHPP